MISALEEKAYIGLLKKWYPKSSQNKRKRTFPLCRCGDGNDQSFTLHIKCTFSIGCIVVFMNVNKVTCRSFWVLQLSTFTQILHWSSIWGSLLEWFHFMQLCTSTELHLKGKQYFPLYYIFLAAQLKTMYLQMWWFWVINWRIDCSFLGWRRLSYLVR